MRCSPWLRLPVFVVEPKAGLRCQFGRNFRVTDQ
jgi:hypothetical protein